MTHHSFQVYSNYIGIPFADERNQDPNKLNCWQLVQKVMVEQFNKHPPDYDFCGDRYRKAAPIFMTATEEWQEVSFESREPGDVVLLTMQGHPVHVGILVKRDIMLHTMSGICSCAERITSAKWCKRISGIYRWPT